MAHGQLTKNHTHHCYILLEKLKLHNEIIRVIFLHMWAALLSMGTTKCRPTACMEWWPARYRLQRLQWRGSSVQSLGCVASVAGRRCLQPGFLPAHQAYLIHTTGKQQGQAFPALPVLLSPSIKDHNALGPSAGTNTAITHISNCFAPKAAPQASQPDMSLGTKASAYSTGLVVLEWLGLDQFTGPAGEQGICLNNNNNIVKIVLIIDSKPITGELMLSCNKPLAAPMLPQLSDMML